jgi:hypothetical protein
MYVQTKPIGTDMKKKRRERGRGAFLLQKQEKMLFNLFFVFLCLFDLV